MWIVFIFWIAAYALFVKIIVWAYEKFFEKKNINENIKWEDCISFKTDDFPIVIENKHQRNRQITGRIFFIGYFSVLLYLLSIPLAVPDSSKALSGYLGIKTAQIGILFMIFIGYKNSWGLIRNSLNIEIYKDHIIYENIDENGKKVIHNIVYNKIKSVGWSFFPTSFIEHKHFSMDKKLSKDKFKYLFGAPFRIIMSGFEFLIFTIMNLFKINRYYIIETDNIVFSVPWASRVYFRQNIHFSKSTFLN